MDLYTLTREFEKEDILENFESIIWTERYYGDGETEIVFPLSQIQEVVAKIPLNSFLAIDESDEPMIVETVLIEDKKIKVQGISVTSWFNNRFVRTEKSHKIRTWEISDERPGEILWSMVSAMLDPDSPYLTAERTDVPTEYLTRLAIPELGLHSYDTSGQRITVAIPFGPLYDQMRNIATTYQVGMQVVLERNFNPDAIRPLGFRSYTGKNRTYSQDPSVPQNDIVRFSGELNSLGNITELRSQSIYKTLALMFAPNTDTDLGEAGDSSAGVAFPEGDSSTSFDCRAVQVFVEELHGYPDPLSSEQIFKIITMLNNAGKDVLAKSPLVKVVDGDVLPEGMFQIGRDYFLGDIVEVEGSDGFVSVVRVTEYIRSQDSSGEREYGIFSRNSDVVAE